MLINELLFNSEAWHSVTQQDILSFEILYESLLRCLLGAHSKTPLEMLYLESGARTIRFVLASRRLPGDFIKLVEEDSNRLGVPLDMSFVENSTVNFYKS